MNDDRIIFDDVSLLVTHYNRSKSLERLLRTFAELGMEFIEIIVSDDASKPKHRQYLEQLSSQYRFRLIKAPVNGGLGNNLNKGQDAVNSPYTLYVQEDFVPLPEFKLRFPQALEMLKENQDIDIARFYSYAPYPYSIPYRHGFSKLIYKPWFIKTHKIYQYSDHPHLRRSNFFQKFGRYTEGIKSDKTEYEMCLSFIQNRGTAIFFDNYKELFQQENSSEEPSTVTRSHWKQSDYILVSLIRGIYRQLKYNYDLHIDRRFKK